MAWSTHRRSLAGGRASSASLLLAGTSRLRSQSGRFLRGPQRAIPCYGLPPERRRRDTGTHGQHAQAARTGMQHVSENIFRKNRCLPGQNDNLYLVGAAEQPSWGAAKHTRAWCAGPSQHGCEIARAGVACTVKTGGGSNGSAEDQARLTAA